jgi:hypothetical protein
MCVTIARMLASEASSIAYILMDRGASMWKQLLAALTAHNDSTHCIDVDIRRHCLWIFSQLAIDRDNRGDLGQELFPVLISSLRDEDSLINKLAADVLFMLADDSENRRELIDTSLEFLVEQASMLDPNEKKLVEGDSSASISKGCAKVLLLLTVKSRDEEFRNLLRISGSVFLLILKYIYCRLAQAATSFVSGQSSTLAVKATAKEFMPFISGYLSTLCSHISIETLNLREVLAANTDLWPSIIGAVGSILSCDWVSMSSAHVVGVVQKDKMWEENLNRHLIVESLLQLLKVSELKLNVVKNLITTAKTCWVQEGQYIFNSLLDAADDAWIRTVSSIDVEKLIILPSVQLFNVAKDSWKPFEQSTYLVLDWLSRWCYGNDGPIRSNQAKVLIHFAVELGQSVPHQFTYKLDSSGFLEVSVDGKIWRSLLYFFKYEFVDNLKDFLRSSLKLWRALCAGSYDAAITSFRKVLTFDQLHAGMKWASDSTNALLSTESFLFIDLMTSLYVATDLSFPRYLNFSGRMVQTSEDHNVSLSNFKHHQYAATTPEEVGERVALLQQYVDHFFGIHWPTSDAEANTNFSQLKNLGFHIPFALAMLDFINNLVRYGLFSESPRLLLALKAGIVRIALGHLSFSKKRTTSRYLAGLVAVKIEALKLLEVIEDADQYILIDGVSKLLIRSWKSAGNTSAVTAELLREQLAMCDHSGQLSDLSIVRLNELISGHMAKQLHQPQNMMLLDNRTASLDAEFMALCEKADPTVVDLSMRVQMKFHASLKSLLDRLDNFCLYSSEDFAVLNSLLELVDKWSKIDLTKANTSARQHLAAQLSGLNFILQGRSIGAFVQVGDEVIRVADAALPASSQRVGTVRSIKGDVLQVQFTTAEDPSHVEPCCLGVREDIAVTGVLLRVESQRKQEFQNLAQFVGIFDVVVAKIAEVGQLTSFEGCDMVISGLFESITSFVRGNVEAKRYLIKHPVHMNAISHCCGSAETIDLAVDALENICNVLDDELYCSISLKFLLDILQGINSLEEFRKQTLLHRLIGLLLVVMPSEKVLVDASKPLALQESMSPRSVFQAQEIQKTVMRGILESDVLAALAECIDNLSNRAEFSFAFDDGNICLVELLSRCTLCSQMNWTELQTKFNCFSVQSIESFFGKLSSHAFGFETRARIMRPWLLLVHSLNISFPKRVDDDENSEVSDDCVDIDIVEDFIEEEINLLKNPLCTVGIASNAFTVTETKKSLTEGQHTWTFVTVPNVPSNEKCIKVFFDTHRSYEYYSVKIFRKPPKTSSGVSKFRSSTSIEVFSSEAPGSAVRGTIDANCIISIGLTSKVYFDNVSARTGYEPSYSLRGRILNVTNAARERVNGTENGWITISPETCRLCDADGVIWDTPSQIIAEYDASFYMPHKQFPLIIDDDGFVIEFICAPRCKYSTN